MPCGPCKDRPNKQHRGTIQSPPLGRDSRGQPEGDPVTVATGVYFSFKPLAGREFESARQVFAGATSRITMNINRSWGLSAKMWILRTSGPKAGTRLNIGYIQDELTDGRDTPILCGEGDLS